MPYQYSHNSIHDLQRRIAVYEDEAAYRELFFLLFNPLTHFATSIVQSKETAEEIVSDVFIQLWKNRSGIDQIADLKLYIYISVRNLSVQKYKQQHKKKTVSLDMLELDIPTTDQDPEKLMLFSETYIRVQQAIELLPTRARLIFRLAKEHRMRYKDIAALLHISVKTVDNQLAIAVKKIASAVQFRSPKKK